MNTVGGLLLAAFVVAAVDWFAVGTGRRSLEYVAKPATMVPLIAAAIVLDPVDDAMRWWFVAALVLSLAGDVFLMLPDEERYFVPGLGSFLLAHIAYIVGFVVGGVSSVAIAISLVPLGVAVGALAPIVVAGARRHDQRLTVPVTAYVTVISTMVVVAMGSVTAAGIGGALLFYLSDLTIGWTRFVRDIRSGRIIIITTYHAAQILLVVSLLATR